MHPPLSIPAHRLPHNEALAIDPQLGSIFVCGACDWIHFDFGDIRFRANLASFQSLLVLMNRAAANYELWLERRGGAA